MTVGYVIVKRLDVDDEKTEGGIVKPEIARTRSQRGIVVAAAKDMLLANQLLPLDIHPGDEVLFTKYGGSDIEIDGQNTCSSIICRFTSRRLPLWQITKAERLTCPPEFQSCLTDIFGVNVFGEPNFKILWGQTETYDYATLSGATTSACTDTGNRAG